MLNKSFASLYKLGDSQVSMAVPNFLSSDSGLQILHSALRFRSFTPPDGCVYGDKDGCVYGDKECHSKQPLVVILSTLSLSFRAKRRIWYRRPSETASPDMDPVRRDVAGLTSLRIRQQFSTKISVPRLFPFAYAGGDGIHPGRGRWRTGDMHRRPSIYAPSIIGEHISTKMSRYARLTLDIRFLRHHQGAYLL